MKFPLPMRPFPMPLALSGPDHDALVSLADGLLQNTLQEYDQLTLDPTGRPDAFQWKPIKQRQNLVVYQERGSTAYVRNRRANPRPDAGEVSQSQSRFALGGDVAAGDGLQPQYLLWHGSLEADLDDLMYGVVSQSEAVTQIRNSYMDTNIVDSAILASMRSSAVQDPFRGLQLRWTVTSGLTKSSLMVRHRDFVFIESTGTTTSPESGERVGYRIIHSVEVRGAPELSDFKLIRGSMASYQVFRQKGNGMVEVFAKVWLDLAGDIPQGMSFSVAADQISTLFGAVECAHRRKLNWMVYKAMADTITATSTLSRDESTCGVCTKSIKRSVLQHFNKKKKHSECCICATVMCARCSVPYKLSLLLEEPKTRVVQLGVECCTRCVHAATRLNAQQLAATELAMPDSLAVYRCHDILDKLKSSTSIAMPEILDVEFSSTMSSRSTEMSANLFDRDIGSVSSVSSHQSSNSNRQSATHAIGRFT